MTRRRSDTDSRKAVRLIKRLLETFPTTELAAKGWHVAEMEKVLKRHGMSYKPKV